MTRCPACDAEMLHRSRTRSTLERLKKHLTAERPHRCLNCGWRGWNPEQNFYERTAVDRSDPPSFDEIELALGGGGTPADSKDRE
jgi:predicted RNA-binding Zn-ribbon protein involved in translation (DUF1610 family)